MSTSTKPDSDFEKFRKMLLGDMVTAKASPEDIMQANEVFTNTYMFMTKQNLLSAPNGVAMESYTQVPQLIYNATEGVAAIKREEIVDFVTTCKVADAFKHACAMEVARIITGGTSDAAPFYDHGRDGGGKNRVDPRSLFSSRSMSAMKLEQVEALESFGEYSDRVTSDSRLSVALTVLRAHKSLVDKVFARRAEEDPVVIIKIPSPETYNLATSQNPVASVRYSGRQPLISLYRNPALVNTQPQQVIPLKSLDTQGWLVADGQVTPGVSVNLLDLTLQQNVVGYTNADWTDLISDGGQVGTVYITLVRNVSGTLTTEIYALQTQFLRSSYFTTQTNVQDSGDRACNIVGTFALTVGALMSNGNASAILSGWTGVNLVLKVNFNATMNIKNWYVEGNGAVAMSTATQLTSLPGGVSTTFGELTATISGWSPLLYFSEENMRKTTAAVRMNFKEQEFLIPVGRNFIVDYSIMGQTIDSSVTNVVSEVINIGNSARSMNILQETLTNVGARLTFENANPEIDYYQSVAQDFAAGTLSLPHVYVGTLDCTDAAVMRESERLTDIHSYFAYRILGLIADGHNKSMYTDRFEPGERARYKVITSGPIGDLLFGVDQYWNALEDKLPAARDADYSMKLANGTVLDIVKSNFIQFADLMLIIPIREAKPDDVTSFGTVLDRGVFVGNYTPVNNGAANKRIVANSREILYPTNPLGYVITVAGIPAQLEITVDGPGM